MLLLYYLLSLLFIFIQHAHTHLAESEAINKIISDILAKAEQKNTDPIKFTWSDRFVADYKYITPKFKDVRDIDRAHTEECERILSGKNDYSTSLKILKDIMKSTSAPMYSAKRGLELSTFRHAQTRKANHSSKSRTHYKGKSTTPIATAKTEVDMKKVQETTSSLAETPSISTEATTESMTPMRENQEIFITRIAFSGTRGRIFSGSIFDKTSEFTTTRTTSVTIKEQITSTFTTTPTAKKTSYGSVTYTFASPSSSESTVRTTDNLADKYDAGDDEGKNEPTSTESSFTHDAKLHKKKLSVIKAIEDLINSIPNYNANHESSTTYEGIMNNITANAGNGSAVIRDATGALSYKPKHGIGVNLFKTIGDKKTSSVSRVQMSDLTRMVNLAASATTPIVTKELNSLPTPNLLSSTNPSTKSSTEFASKSQSSPNTVDSTTNHISPTDIYLLVDENNKQLKGYFTIKPHNKAADKANKVVTINENQMAAPAHHKVVHEKHKSKWKQKSGVTDNPVLDLYNEINAYNIDIAKSHLKLEEKRNKETPWDRIMRFFGHDRVCNCKCIANRTMCKVCSASDRVMRELTFEFTNLAKYMNDHCMEVQTYFWMNPSGGKKLRDSVHRIDKSLNDYYKRVRGKCKGRTCKTFATYLDKRHDPEQFRQSGHEVLRHSSVTI